MNKPQKNLLQGKLRRRLAEIKAPKATLSPAALNLVMQGKLLLVCVQVSKPCSCDMCQGMHEGTVCFVTPPTRTELEKLFAA